MSYSLPMTLKDLKQAVNKYSPQLENSFICLIRKQPGSRNKSLEIIYSGDIVLFDTLTNQQIEELKEKQL